MKQLLLLGALLLAGCTSAKESGIEVIVGAELHPANQAPIEHSIVIVEHRRFTAVGTQAAVPVPKGSEITQGLGHIVEPLPGGNPIETGQPANLQLRNLSSGTIEKVMRSGEWVQQ